MTAEQLRDFVRRLNDQADDLERQSGKLRVLASELLDDLKPKAQLCGCGHFRGQHHMDQSCMGHRGTPPNELACDCTLFAPRSRHY